MKISNKTPLYVAGFDGGGSTARLAIADMDGKIVFRQQAGGVSPIDNPEWKMEYEKLFAAAGRYLNHVKSACFGVPGWGEVPQLDRQVSSFLHHHFPCPIKIMNDVELAYHAAFDEGLGILLLSGTGSMAIGRSLTKEFIRAGGFGHLIGDEGSAYWIGQRALQHLAREIDGRAPKSVFGIEISKHLGFDLTPEGLIAWVEAGKHPRSHIANVSILVDEMAERGDGLARDLLISAAKELFGAWQAVRRQLDNTAHQYPWASAGSVFRSKIIRRAIRDLIGYDSTMLAQSALEKAVHIASQPRAI